MTHPDIPIIPSAATMPDMPFLCRNGCEIDRENPLLPDGYCQGCHDYPEG